MIAWINLCFYMLEKLISLVYGVQLCEAFTTTAYIFTLHIGGTLLSLPSLPHFCSQCFFI